MTSRSPSEQPALFVEREYNATLGFAKAARQSAATRAANSQGVSGIHSDVPITCSFTAEVVNGLSTECHFSVSTEHARRSMEQAAEYRASSVRQRACGIILTGVPVLLVASILADSQGVVTEM